MDQQALITFFLNSRFFSADTATMVAGSFKEKTIDKGAFLLTEGKISDEYFFLESGYMRSFANDINGNEITTGFHQEGQVVFEVFSFFNRTRTKENIQALTDCKGWYTSYDELNGLFHSMPQFREFGRSVLVKGFASLKGRMLGMITETAEERYLQLIQHQPQVFRYAQLRHIASYLGITDTSLSRIRKEMSKK